VIDVVVIGGGPAGTTAAIRLAQLGFGVRLFERAAFPRPHVGESLSPGVWVHLRTLGVDDRVLRAGFRQSHVTLLRWRGETERVVSERPSLIVDRARFDALLLAAARDSGVDVRQPCEPFGLDDARFVVDASGRSGVTRRARRPTAPRTIAWHARWRDAGGRNETLVERLFVEGAGVWLWGTALPDGSFSAMAFGDPREPMPSMLARSQLFGWLGGDPIEPVRAADATPYVCDDPIDMRSCAAGDAAVAIDPISSSGVQVAMGGSIAASVAINTILRRPGDAPAAIRFYREHVARVSRRHAAWSAEAYDPVTPPGPSLPFEVTSELLAANSEAMVITPAVRGDFVELVDAVRVSGGEDVAYLGGTPLAPLVASVTSPSPARRIVERWSETMPPERAAAVLRWLVEQQVIVRL